MASMPGTRPYRTKGPPARLTLSRHRIYPVPHQLVIALLFLFPRHVHPYLIYLHWVRIPLWIDWTNGEAYGFRAGTLRTLHIVTPDEKCLGAWHILPRGHAPSLLEPAPGSGSPGRRSTNTEEEAKRFDAALAKAQRVFLYFHGNAGNRATFTRTDMYKIMTRMAGDSHVVAIDYRGFGDSDAVLPTEAGLRVDALAAFDWIRAMGVDSKRIVLVGHSLGSGVATYLAHHLSTSSTLFGGLILLSAYHSMPDAALGYPYIPLAYPLRFLGTWIRERVKAAVTERWESHKNIRSVRAPILLVHGARDFEILPWQARSLFLHAITARILGQGLAGEGAGTPSLELAHSNATFQTSAAATHPGFRIHPLPRQEAWLARSSPTVEAHQGECWYLEARYGGHNSLNRFGVVEDVMAAWLEAHHL